MSGWGKPQLRNHLASSEDTFNLTAANPSKLQWDEFELLYEDRYFYIDNRGLTRVIVELNGYQFKLATDPVEIRQGQNTYLIPLRGVTNIDIRPLLNTRRNLMRLEGRGPAGADAEIIIGDSSLIPTIIDTIHYVLSVVRLPQGIRLLQNYPNPFNLSTNIVYEVPQSLTDGVNVHLSIYDLLGRKVRTLVHSRNFPGSFTVQWNGMDDNGMVVAGGVYLYRLVVGESNQTRRLVLLK
jgi:hypothetical protein